MDLPLYGLSAYVSTAEARKKLRYAGVSVVFVPIGQILVQGFGLWFNNYTIASLVQAAIITVPNFFANKHFVWRVMSRENLRNQMLVFWGAIMLGVSLATLFTNLVENAMADTTTLVRGAAVFFAQLLGFGIVWVGRYLILDRWLFKLTSDTPEHADRIIGESRPEPVEPVDHVGESGPNLVGLAGQITDGESSPSCAAINEKFVMKRPWRRVRTAAVMRTSA